jgi:hypothetical protein
MTNIEEGESPKRNGQRRSSRVLDWLIAILLLGLLTFLTYLLVGNLRIEKETYTKAISVTLANLDNFGREADPAAVIALSRALDFATTKTSALFLAYVLIFLGALYVLRTASAAYDLSVAGPVKGTLHSSSPGLVMLTLGVVIVIVTLTTHSTVGYDQGTKIAKPERIFNPPPPSVTQPQPATEEHGPSTSSTGP